MDHSNDISPSISTIRAQTAHSGRRSLPPANVVAPQHDLPSYPSSTLHHYYPSPLHAANSAHISTFPQPLPSHPPVGGDFGLLPSVSELHVPSLRRTPSVPTSVNTNIHPALNSPFPDQRFNDSRNSQRIQSLSPIAFHQQSAPFFAAPQPTHLPPVHMFSPQLPQHNTQPNPHSIIRTVNPHSKLPTSHFSSSLSTNDIPLLSGKHDWGPWHSAARTLFLNANLLGHIADDPLPGASFDPGLWPTYPPVIHQGSSQAEIQSFNEWWSRDGLASHILTSRLTPSVLGCIPIPNDRMGQRRSARAVYSTLRHQFSAGDYSAVMIIEARLRQLRCLPIRGGVHVAEFINTW
jgi:hypothetical protein